MAFKYDQKKIAAVDCENNVLISQAHSFDDTADTAPFDFKSPELSFQFYATSHEEYRIVIYQGEQIRRRVVFALNIDETSVKNGIQSALVKSGGGLLSIERYEAIKSVIKDGMFHLVGCNLDGSPIIPDLQITFSGLAPNARFSSQLN